METVVRHSRVNENDDETDRDNYFLALRTQLSMKNREIEHSNAALNANIERESSLRQDIVMLRQDVARQEAAFESSQQALYDARTVVRIQERQLNDDRVLRAKVLDALSRRIETDGGITVESNATHDHDVVAHSADRSRIHDYTVHISSSLDVRQVCLLLLAGGCTILFVIRIHQLLEREEFWEIVMLLTGNALLLAVETARAAFKLARLSGKAALQALRPWFMKLQQHIAGGTKFAADMLTYVELLWQRMATMADQLRERMEVDKVAFGLAQGSAACEDSCPW